MARFDADLVVWPRLCAVGHLQPPHAVQTPYDAEGRPEAGAGQRPGVAVREDHGAIPTVWDGIGKDHKNLHLRLLR